MVSGLVGGGSVVSGWVGQWVSGQWGGCSVSQRCPGAVAGAAEPGYLGEALALHVGLDPLQPVRVLLLPHALVDL